MATGPWADLPLEAQIVLASGYIAYSLGYFGSRDNHKVPDQALRTLAFSLIATFGMFSAGLVWESSPIWFRGSIALGASMIAGCVWRRFGSDYVVWAMRKLDISWSNNDISAIATIIKDSKFPVSQIAVKLDSGDWLRCDDTRKFSDAPFGPCIIGDDGSVALYLTHRIDSKGEVKELGTTTVLEYGDRLSYVPANRVVQLNLRHINPHYPDDHVI